MKQPILKVSLPGIDVEKAVLNECVVNSDYSCYKSKPSEIRTISLNTTIPATGRNVMLTIPHEFSFRPACTAIIRDNNDPADVWNFLAYFVSDSAAMAIECNETKCEVVMYVIEGATLPFTFTGSIRYYIFAHNGAS